jgi:signal transduction histidine kinase
MAQSRRLLLIHLAAVLLPCAIIGLVGYRWLQLDEDAQARRSKDAVELEGAQLRRELSRHLTNVTEGVLKTWSRAPDETYPFRPPPELPKIVVCAYLFSSKGALIYPSYDAAFQELVRDYQSAVSSNRAWQQATTRADLLEAQGKAAEARRVLQEALTPAAPGGLRAAQLLYLGRLAMAARDHALAESDAARILECCAASRDEYGISFALYAAAQLATSYEAQGRLQEQWPPLAERLRELLRKGTIGHPRDLSQIAELAARSHRQPVSSLLDNEAQESADRIRRQTETGRQLEKWIAGVRPYGGQAGPGFLLSTFRSEASPQLAGIYTAEDGRTVVALYAPDRLAAWLQARAQERAHFDVSLLQDNRRLQADTPWNAGLSPEAPEFKLALQVRESDPATQQRRRSLFAVALGAAILLTLVVGYFALRDAARELKTASLRSGFITGVTHELKTPLTSLRLLAETLRLKRTRDPATADELLDAIVVESERLTRLIDNVLSFSRIEGGTRTYQKAETDLSEGVDAAVERFRHILEQGGFSLVQERSEEPLRVYADPEALTQALSNLLGNAVKYSGLSREIRVGVYRHGREAEVRVTDHGIGISKADQKRIFESYYRAPDGAKEAAGAGLGLALVRHFADAHGGRVTVASEPGKGSTFSLWLPLPPPGGNS